LCEDGRVVRCALRGKIKKELQLKKDKLYLLDPVAVGDVVEISLEKDDFGAIEKIEERKNYLSRKAPRIKGAGFRGERLEQIIASNIDRLFVVTSLKNPDFNNRMLDRILVASESGGIESKIIFNKIDLAGSQELQSWNELYSHLGYETFSTNALTGEGLEGVKSMVQNGTSLFWGASGVGKSSILNFLFPQLNLKIGDISDYSKKGTHTTVTVTMLKVGENAFVIDTPGIREIAPYGIKKEDLGHYFKEFVRFIPECKFNSCTHNHEPGCAVREGVEKGLIDKRRYVSYLNILNGLEDGIYF
jgi:ribosome biogenesis GTPase